MKRPRGSRFSLATYTEFSIWVAPIYTETLGWVLQEYGCQGVVVSELPAEGPMPTEVAVKIYETGDAETLAAWRTGLEEGLAKLKGHFPELTYRLTVRPVDEEDWAHSWKQYWHALEIGRRFVVKPTWEPYDARPDQLVIELDPKQAFGTGTHATTQLCLQGLEQAAPALVGQRILDVGTGSGILAVGALLLGAAHVDACDLDPIAVEATLENATVNGVADRIVALRGGIDVLAGPVPLVVINILAEVIVELAPAIADRLAPGGLVLASGIIPARRDDVIAAFAANGMTTLETREQDGWVLVVAGKAAGSLPAWPPTG